MLQDLLLSVGTLQASLSLHLSDIEGHSVLTLRPGHRRSRPYLCMNAWSMLSFSHHAHLPWNVSQPLEATAYLEGSGAAQHGTTYHVTRRRDPAAKRLCSDMQL